MTPGPPAPVRERRFACTQCGACCNRSPEVELSEAAPLADVFVFRLMFRLYELPRSYVAARGGTGSAEQIYESKRLLDAFAARKSPRKYVQGGKAVDYVQYLTMSALTLDAGTGACGALAAGRCTIYARRPLACRTLPFHYSRPEAAAQANLDAFVATPGYRCDTTPAAPVVMEAGRIVGPDWRGARADAVEQARQDRRWRELILRAMKANAFGPSLPGLGDIERNAAFGATTTSMRVAWQIAANAGLMTEEQCVALVAAQSAAIDRSLRSPCAPATRETLVEMRAEYRALLERAKGPALYNSLAGTRA